MLKFNIKSKKDTDNFLLVYGINWKKDQLEKIFPSVQRQKDSVLKLSAYAGVEKIFYFLEPQENIRKFSASNRQFDSALLLLLHRNCVTLTSCQIEYYILLKTHKLTSSLC